MIKVKSLLKEINSNTIQNLNTSRQVAHQWCENNGGIWPKEQQFLHVIEETGELVDEILNRQQKNSLDLTKEVDELGDLWFTYLTFIDNQDFKLEEWEKFIIYKYILKKTQRINWETIGRDILLRFITEISRENKILRKLSGKKDNYKYSELDIKKSQALCLFYLYILTRSYSTTVKKLINSAINKYENRDIKKK